MARVLVPVGCVVLLAALGAILGAWGGGAWAWPVAVYVASAVLVGGVVVRVLSWARVPVPFRIPTTCGQQASLPWIQPARWDNPSTRTGVVGRLALEVLAFRSLLRNVAPGTDAHGAPSYRWSPWLWAAALAFHGSMALIWVRHLRLAGAADLSRLTAAVDAPFLVGTPQVYATSVLFVAGLGWLLGRRLVSPALRYLSLPGDWLFPTLLLAIGLTGLLLRHAWRTDLIAVQGWVVSVATLRPRPLPAGASPLLHAHLALVCGLAVLFPFSKMMHAVGVLMSPTRNLSNDSRARRHVNPWATPPKFRTWAEYEDEFRDRMVAAGLPVERSGREGEEP